MVSSRLSHEGILNNAEIPGELLSDYDELPYDDENLARAFALAIELMREHRPFSEELHHNAHELTDLLSYPISATPLCCPDCSSSRS
jgi:hypothetical protein